MSVTPFLNLLLALTRFAVSYPGADSVAVAGSWNDWDLSLLAPCADTAGMWELDLDIPAGEYEYRFVIDGTRWIRDPRNPRYGGSFSNSILRIQSPNHPSLATDYPLPGTVIQTQPFRFSAAFIPGGDGAPPDPRHCVLSAGIRRVACDVTTRGGDHFLTGAVDSLPEGEVTITFHARSKTGYAAEELQFRLLINCRNQPPKAVTEAVVVARPGWPLVLDGGRSYDPDGEPLVECRWDVLEAPAEVLLETPESFYPVFVPLLGSTQLAFVVSDGTVWSEPDTLHVMCRGPEVQPAHFTFEPDSLKYHPLDIRSVCVAGTWNGWRVAKDTLSPRADGSWEAWLYVDPGTHEYQFVLNDSQWISNPPGAENGSNYTIRIPPYWQQPPRLELTRPRWDAWQVRVLSQQRSTWELFATIDGFRRGMVTASDPLLVPQKTALVMKAVLIPADETSSVEPCYIVSSNGHANEGALSCITMPPRWAKQTTICCLDQEPFRETVRKLSLLADIGFTALWIPPIFAGPAPHGYAPTDLFAVRSSLGSRDDLDHLVRAAHGLGLHVLLDFVVNHTSDQHPRFRSAGDRASIWHDWYLWHDGSQPAHWFDWDQLVNLNLKHPSVRHHLAAAAAYWQELDVDGYRLDVAWAMPMELVRHLKEYTRSKNGEFILLGEVIPREPRYHYNGLDVAYDTDFYGIVLDLLSGQRTTDEIPSIWDRISSRYPPTALGMTYLENPDTPFLRSLFPDERCDVASLMQFTWPGIPMVRDPLSIPSDSMIATSLLRDLLSLRTSCPALREGALQWLAARDGILSYVRTGDMPCIVVVNLSGRQQDAALDTSSLSNGRSILWKTVFHVGTPPSYTQRGERLTVHCPAASGTVFVPDDEA